MNRYVLLYTSRTLEGRSVCSSAQRLYMHYSKIQSGAGSAGRPCRRCLRDRAGERGLTALQGVSLRLNALPLPDFSAFCHVLPAGRPAEHPQQNRFAGPPEQSLSQKPRFTVSWSRKRASYWRNQNIGVCSSTCNRARDRGVRLCNFAEGF